MIAARFDTGFRSLLLLIVGTAMIISLAWRGETDSAVVVKFNSGLSTVMAKSIEPRPDLRKEKNRKKGGQQIKIKIPT